VRFEILLADAVTQLTAPGQFYELRTAVIDGVPLKMFANLPGSLRELFDANRSDATFIVYEEERYSFEQAWASAARIARILIDEYGVNPGDRVAISMRNYPEWVLAFMAVTSIGAVAVALNALWQPDELEYCLDDCGAKLLFADQGRLDQLAQCRADLPVQVIAVRPTKALASGRDLKDLLAKIGSVPMPPPDSGTVDGESAAIIFYTSGSTGHPKGVVSSHRNILTALFSWELDAHAGVLISEVAPEPLTIQEATLLAVPLFHVTASHAVFLRCFRAQRKMVCMYKWDPAIGAELIEREQIDSFIAPAAVTGDLVREARRTSRDLSSLAMIGGGGAPRASEQVRSIDTSFANAVPVTGWGMTETNAIGTGIGGPDYLARPASSGRCSAVLEIRIVDDAGNTLPANSRGEMLIRGSAIFMGYWRKQGVDATMFENGWFRTGDVGYLDDEGYLFVVDRIKDLIIRGGENIGCGHVEAALLMYPGVEEVAVYPVPDDRLGEEVGATVFASSALDIDTLRDFLSQHLARFEVPRYITVVDTPLPRTASGKILKRELRDQAVRQITQAT
jgi:long-chain acyl-CoA synthetase